MRQYLHMDKHPLERLIQWRDMIMWAMKRVFPLLISREEVIWELPLDASSFYSIRSNKSTQRMKTHGTLFLALFFKFIRKRSMIFSIRVYSKLKILKFLISNWNGLITKPIKLKISLLLKSKVLTNACSYLKRVSKIKLWLLIEWTMLQVDLTRSFH